MLSNSRESTSKILKSLLKTSFNEELCILDMTLLSCVIYIIPIEFEEDNSNDLITEITCGKRKLMNVISTGRLDEDFYPFSKYYRNMFSVTTEDISDRYYSIMTIYDEGEKIVYRGEDDDGDRRHYIFNKMNRDWYSGYSVIMKLDYETGEHNIEPSRIVKMNIVRISSSNIICITGYNEEGIIIDSNDGRCYLDRDMVFIEGIELSDDMEAALDMIASRR